MTIEEVTAGGVGIFFGRRLVFCHSLHPCPDGCFYSWYCATPRRTLGQPKGIVRHSTLPAAMVRAERLLHLEPHDYFAFHSEKRPQWVTIIVRDACIAPSLMTQEQVGSFLFDDGKGGGYIRLASGQRCHLPELIDSSYAPDLSKYRVDKWRWREDARSMTVKHLPPEGGFTKAVADALRDLFAEQLAL